MQIGGPYSPLLLYTQAGSRTCGKYEWKKKKKIGMRTLHPVERRETHSRLLYVNGELLTRFFSNFRIHLFSHAPVVQRALDGLAPQDPGECTSASTSCLLAAERSVWSTSLGHLRTTSDEVPIYIV